MIDIATAKCGAATKVNLASEENCASTSNYLLTQENRPARWGHVYITGALESIEFFSSEFSALFPCGEEEIVLAEPRTACQELDNRFAGKILLVERGECTFAQKAQFAAQAQAASIIVVNSNNALLAMPHDNSTLTSSGEIPFIPSVMIRKRAGLLLEEALRHGRIFGLILGEVSHRSEGERLVSVWRLNSAIGSGGRCPGRLSCALWRV